MTIDKTPRYAEYERVLELSMCEFEQGARRMVEQAFEAARALSGAVCNMPFTGEEYDPEQHERLLQRAALALCARHEFQRAEAVRRRAQGERLADIAKSYAVDISMVSRLPG